jgi:hypothetical protein
MRVYIRRFSILARTCWNFFTCLQHGVNLGFDEENGFRVQRETIGTAVCNLYLRLEKVIMTRCFRRFRAAKRELLIRSCLQIWCRLRVFSWGSPLDLEFPRIVL